MNWNQVEGQWGQIKGSLKQKWGKLTDDDLTQLKGRRDRIVAKLQERYGDAKEKFETEIDEFIARI